MLIEHFAMSCEDDAAGRPSAARPGGTGESLSAAEPVEILGGHLAPAPAAAGPEPAHRVVPLGLGEAALDKFVQDYLQMLDGRLDTIRGRLVGGDTEGAFVAVLSLESSSAMLGGVTLAARLAELRTVLDGGTATRRDALLTLVEGAATDFRRDLEAGRRS